ncbi:hypothetical protein [Candidatus Electronema sp. TJ]|uniref:hypothetical protein n=1 Tax=Candidatus Electronema sp. TJ TaxID=3401573 RepID=UPI003AA8D7D5
MAIVGSRYRLINGPDRQHNFYFQAQEIPNGKIRVSLEAERIEDAKATVDLSKGDESRIRFQIHAFGTIYWAEGILRWDAPYNVVRYQGFIRLANVAEIFMEDCPVLELP